MKQSTVSCSDPILNGWVAWISGTVFVVLGTYFVFLRLYSLAPLHSLSSDVLMVLPLWIAAAALGWRKSLLKGAMPGRVVWAILVLLPVGLWMASAFHDPDVRPSSISNATTIGLFLTLNSSGIYETAKPSIVRYFDATFSCIYATVALVATIYAAVV